MEVIMEKTEQQIMNEILDCYVGLSPENLWLDGEATQAQARTMAKRLTTRLKELFKELGREVSEQEAYNSLRS